MPTRFSFSGKRKTGKKKELQGGCPLDPRCGERHHHRMGKQWEDSVQAAQRGQVRAWTVKHSAANYPWLPLEGKAERTVFAPNTETFSAVYVASVSYRSRLARSPGGLGGREPVAAQSPERSFFFPLFLSAEKEKEVIGGDAVTKFLSQKQKPTVSLPLGGEAKVREDYGWYKFPREFRGTTERRRCGIIPVPRSPVSRAVSVPRLSRSLRQEPLFRSLRLLTRTGG